jgi:hypothetical protein
LSAKRRVCDSSPYHLSRWFQLSTPRESQTNHQSPARHSHLPPANNCVSRKRHAGTNFHRLAAAPVHRHRPALHPSRVTNLVASTSPPPFPRHQLGRIDKAPTLPASPIWSHRQGSYPSRVTNLVASTRLLPFPRHQLGRIDKAFTLATLPIFPRM